MHRNILKNSDVKDSTLICFFFLFTHFCNPDHNNNGKNYSVQKIFLVLLFIFFFRKHLISNLVAVLKAPGITPSHNISVRSCGDLTSRWRSVLRDFVINVRFCTFYSAVQSPTSLMFQPLLSHSMTQLPISHAWDKPRPLHPLNQSGQSLEESARNFSSLWWSHHDTITLLSFHERLLKDGPRKHKLSMFLWTAEVFFCLFKIYKYLYKYIHV